MTYRKICKVLALALAALLAAFAAAEGAMEAPRSTAAVFDAMPTLPPVDALTTAAPSEAATPETPAPEATHAPEATPATEATFAPIPDADSGDDGILRVELRSLGQPVLLNLTLAGSYAVEADPGFRFASGTQVALTAAQDRVWLAVGGLSIDMGKTLTLTRHLAPDGAVSGIRIAEAEKDTLYCGDLTVTARGSGLRCVLALPVEDYLYGVVAYEMSDSFPLEALKAQAVAARTYAMRRKAKAGNRDYDLVDTTTDQVFKGYDPQAESVIAAVDETRGVVGRYDGGFATCYYTASNGGQTALASQIWGGKGDDGYLAMADDPYDLENPGSLQNELTVSPICEGSAALKAMLEAALGKAMAAAGVGEGMWAFDSIAAVKPVNPRFEGSRMYDGLQFDLRAKLLQPAATPEGTAATEVTLTTEVTLAPEVTLAAEATQTPAPTEPPMEWVLSDEVYPVTLDVFGQVKPGLSLGLNGGDYELISVQTATDDAGTPRSFTLVMRRYGHGVGMSQRGAQWMAANYGMSWRQILAFYYPGMDLVRMDWPENALTDLDALPAGPGADRPDPTYRPLPEPKDGERYATVTASALNVRREPSTDAAVIEQLARGRKVVVASEPDADGWVKVHTGEVDGFVKGEYSEF